MRGEDFLIYGVIGDEAVRGRINAECDNKAENI